MGLVEAQDVFKTRNDAFFAWGTAGDFDRGDFNAQRVQQFVVVEISHC
jgi:hypothetical protein